MQARYILAALLLATVAAGASTAGGTRVPFASEISSAQADLSMSPGKRYKVRVVAENKGARAWLPGEVTMVARWSAGPGSPKGLDSRGCSEKLPRSIPSNLAVTVVGEVTGPSTPGDWILTIGMAYKGKIFGDTREIRINVPTDYKADVTVRYPAKMDVNRKYSIQVTVRNVGLSDMDNARVLVRLEVKKGSKELFEEFKGKEIQDYKMPKGISASSYTSVNIPLTPRISGDFEVDVSLWDAEERDEITSPEVMKLKIQ